MLNRLVRGSRTDCIAAATAGVIFTVLLALLSRKLWLAAFSPGTEIAKWRVIAVACVFTIGSLGCLAVSGIALAALRSGHPRNEQRSSDIPFQGAMDRPFVFGLVVQLFLWFLASMMLDCGVAAGTCFLSFVLWDVGLVLVRGRPSHKRGRLDAFLTMLGPAVIFAVAMWAMSGSG